MIIAEIKFQTHIPKKGQKVNFYSLPFLNIRLLTAIPVE